jgi:hypothetical protein
MSTQIAKRHKKEVWNETGILQYLRYGIVGEAGKLQKATITFVISVCLSVCLSERNNPAPTGRFFVKFYTGKFHSNLSRENSLE